MYPISQTALNKFQSGAMQYARITIGNTTITNANIVQGGMSINRYCSTGESVTVGSCVAAELSLTLANRDGSWNSFSFDGKEAYVEVGVYTSASTITYIPMGYFVIDEVKFDRNTVTLTALDRLVKFDGAIDATQFTFPYTLKTLLARLCTICGVTLGTTGNFTNYSYSVAALPGEAKTYRDVLRWICELSGTNGYIKYDGKLYIEWYSTSSGFTVTTANRTQSEVDENTFSLTGVTLIQDETRYSAGTSVRPIIIQDNPLVSNNPQTIVNNLNTKLNGFSWCPFNAVTLPAPHLYPMDRCTFTKKDGTNVAVSITGVTYKLNGNTSIVGGGDAKHKGRSYGLQDATFYAANIAAGAITADKISAGAITTEKLDTGAVTTEKINVSVDMATNAGVASTYATKTAAASQEQRIYYRKSATGAPTAPTTWVTATATGNESWTTKRMPYSKDYPYLYTCIQRKTVSGAISNSTVLLDDTTTVIDGGNIITGTVTANAIATGTITATKLADDAVVVGGRNLTLRTATMPTSGTPQWNISVAGTKSTVDIVDAPISGITNAVRVTNETSAATRCGICEGGITGIVVGKMYTVSGWVRASVAGLGIDLRAVWSSSGSTEIDQSYTTTTTWQYVKFEGSLLASSSATSFSACLVHVRNLPVNGWFELCGAKVEEGNKATAWSPAPEDAEAYADDTFATKAAAATDTHRIYYKSNSNSAPTAPTTWVTSTTSNNNTWSVKRMAADTENVYKYIWTCTQIKAVNGTITNSTVLLDDTTTVIDGGNIITGSVDANQIRAGAITTEKINSSVDMATNTGVANTYATKTAAASTNQRIYYRKSATGAPTAPTTWITSTSTANETWTTKRMPYDATYKYLYTCVQTKTVSGAVSNSTVLLDDTTTVIDGGSITTGKVAANRIDVTDLSAFEATIAGWNMDSSRIFKEVTIGDYVYQVYMNAPASPVAGNLAVGIRKRAVDSSTWSYPCYFNYGGDFYATNANITGGSVSGSTVGTGVDAGNLTTGTLSADRIGARSIVADKLDIDDLQAINALIAGWSLTSSQIRKSFTIDDTVYTAYMQAITNNPSDTNGAFVISQKVGDNDTTYPFIVRYNGTLISRKIAVSGEGSISGWSVSDNALSKSRTIGGTTYSAGLYAPTSPDANTAAIKLQGGDVATELQYDGTFQSMKGNESGYYTRLTIDGEIIESENEYHDYVTTDTDRFGDAQLNGSSLLMYNSKRTKGTSTNARPTFEVDLAAAENEARLVLNSHTGTSTEGSIYAYTDGSDAQIGIGLGNSTSVFGYNSLTINNHDLLRLMPKFVNIFATAIPTNANLNTNDYLTVGQYYVSSSATAATQTNCPTTSAYNMKVENPNGSAYDNESTGTWVYRLRTIVDINGDTFIQKVNSGATAGTFTFGAWNKVVLDNALATVATSGSYNDLSDTPTITDTKVTQTATTTSAAYPLLFGASSFTQNEQVTTKTEAARISGGIFVNPNTATINARRIHTGTTSQYGRIVLGNAIASGTAGCSHGEMYLYGKGDKYVRIGDVDGVIDASQTYKLPNKSGYLAIEPEVETGTGTRNTTNASGGSASYTKYGRVVCVSIAALAIKSTATAQNTTLFTGLPAPSAAYTFGIPCVDKGDSATEESGIQLYVDASGNIKIGREPYSVASKFYSGSVTYISAT